MLKRFLFALTLFYTAVCFAGVDVNQASEADLDSIKGIGPAMSGRILAERKKGQFKSWADLTSRVKGLGEKSAARFSAQGLTVNTEVYRAGLPASLPAIKAMPK